MNIKLCDNSISQYRYQFIRFHIFENVYVYRHYKRLF